MSLHWKLVRKNQLYRSRRLYLEDKVKRWIKDYDDDGIPIAIYRIPVVVHIIYNTPEQNISDSQIQSQIVVLNDDYRRLNADARWTPTPFVPVAADSRIEFALAVRDPSCNSTSGITRTPTTVRCWSWGDQRMKSSSTGGCDPWDVKKYLNIWVVNYCNGLGESSFPGSPPQFDGVVCHYRAFGTIGDLVPRANRGRTTTHEIGHYLNLLHIWGNDDGWCYGSDEVVDTPNQAGSSPECPPCRPFPSRSCGNGPNGDMFMNFMDYSPDECMNLFTAGQVSRMHATLNIARSSLLASDGLVPVTPGLVSDLWMKDTLDDVGVEPNLSSNPMYISDDIWIRRINDGLENQEHQNPIYRDSSTMPNYVYVRVRNRGCSGTMSGTLKLYWAKASTGLSWPVPWDGTVNTPALMGGPIGSQLVTVSPRDDEILIFPWMPPDPRDYEKIGADRSHFCLLARIETTNSHPYGMTFPETTDLYSNVQRNNNIAWKNISIVEEVSGEGYDTYSTIANFSGRKNQTMLKFVSPIEDKPSIFQIGEIYLELTDSLIKKYTHTGEENDGIEKIGDRIFKILKSSASLGKFLLDPNELHSIHLRIVPTSKRHLGVHVFNLDLIQMDKDEIVGAQRFVLKNPPDHSNINIDKTKLEYNGVNWLDPEMNR
jgi:hypothetical protein